MKFRLALAILVFNFAAAHAGVLARFNMSAKLGGTIDVELYDLDKPASVSNFVGYVKSGRWHDTVMNQWRRESSSTLPAFIQGGYYNIPHDSTLLTTWSVEPQLVQTFPSIPTETAIGRQFKNLFGTLAMSHTAGDSNSATAGWFFNLKDNPNLDEVDGGYTVFGRALRGTNLFTRLMDTNENNLVLINGTHVPVYTEDNTTAFLLNVDITLLTAEIRIVDGGNEISWNSVEGLPNIVEQSSTISAQWSVVETVTGTGARMSITNNPGSAIARTYRLRINYGQ
jgi:cyclophilin family peptidyl-prolyl cis-trans isomerase